MRYTQTDVRIWTQHVNNILDSAGKNRINTRRHGYNSLTVIERLDQNQRPISDPFYAGNAREVVEYLQAMYKMHNMLTES